MNTENMLRLIIFEAADRGEITNLEKEFMLETVLSIDPIKKFKDAIEDAKYYFPVNTQEKKIQQFLNSYENKIIDAAKILEKEPKRLKNKEIIDVCVFIISYFAAIQPISMIVCGEVITGGALVIGVIASIGIILSIINAIITYVRTRHDQEVLNNLIKIKDRLSALDIDKFPTDLHDRIVLINRKIDDAITETSAILKIAK